MELIYEDGARQQITRIDGNNWLINDKKIGADVHRVSDREFHVLIDGVSYRAFLEKADPETKEVVLIINGERLAIKGVGRYEELLESLGMSAMASAKAKDLKAPMPGLVLEVAVTAGQEVKEGDTLLVLEAMKMENVIKASAAGVVTEVKIAAGDSVEKGQVLVGF
jgi:biotin carboxyl carrier protein